MGLIPEEAYQIVENRLRRRAQAIRRAEEAVRRARERATDISAPAGDGIRGKGGHGSRTERGAISVVRAELRLENARKWEAVFRETDLIYPAESEEGFTARAIYGSGMSQADVARACGCSRQTVRTRQDRYIILAAYTAARRGLIGRGGERIGDTDPAQRGAPAD